MLKREKKKYYSDLDTKIFDSNKKFWQRIKPLFSEKIMLKSNIRLNENGKIISDKKEVAEILNNYFMDSVENLEVERYLPDILIDDNLDDIDKIVRQYQGHPSIVKIKENVKVDKKFEFEDISEEKMFKIIGSLCGVVKIPTLVSCIPIVFSIIVSLYIICGLLLTSLLT